MKTPKQIAAEQFRQIALHPGRALYDTDEMYDAFVAGWEECQMNDTETAAHVKGLALVKRLRFYAKLVEWELPSVLTEAADMIEELSAAQATERERCAMLHEQVNPASDDERLRGIPGAGAMGAVIEYRDMIRSNTDV